MSEKEVIIEKVGKTTYYTNPEDGVKDDAYGWAERLGMTDSNFRLRVRTKPQSEWFKPANRKTAIKLIEIGGVERTAMEWSDISGVSVSTIWYRYRRGVRGEELISRARTTRGRPNLSEQSEEKKLHFDPYKNVPLEDLELARRIKGLQRQGLSDDEILIKLKAAA